MTPPPETLTTDELDAIPETEGPLYQETRVVRDRYGKPWMIGRRAGVLYKARLLTRLMTRDSDEEW